MLRIYSIYCLLFVLFFGCKKEYSYEGGHPSDGPTPGDSVIYKSEWEFKESILYKGPVDTAFLTKESGGQVLTINGKTAVGDQQLKIVVFNDKTITKGTFATNQLQVRFFYLAVSDTVYAARPYYGGDMYVTITEIDDRHVAGTFRGTSLDKNKQEKNIIEGKFSSPLKKTGNATGSVLLWASEQCNGTIKVKVNGLPGEITAFPYITPDCGEAGSASFNLKPGTYRWVAYCTTDSISGMVSVNRDSCSKIKIIFPFRPAPVTYTSNDSCVVATINSIGVFKPNSIFAGFAGKKVSSISFPVDVYNGMEFVIAHDFVYTNNAIDILGGRHKFQMDGLGRVKEYAGLLIPDKWQSQGVINKYFYNGANQLTEVQVYRSDGTPFRTIRFNWLNGNIISIKAEYLAGGGGLEIFLDYYMNKPVASFPFIFLNVPELFLFQSGLSFGVSNKKALKSKRVLAYTSNNTLLSDNSWIYESYIMDANNYIQAMSATRDDPWGSQTRFTFTYKCF